MQCPKCGKKYPSGHKFCQDCGARLIEKPSAGGFNLNFGDANAISGGVNLSDSHNVHNEDKSVHNISNVSNVTNNVTNVAAQKTEIEILQEKKTLYLNECKRANEDNVLDKAEIIALEEYRLKIGLDKATADKILEKVRQMTVDKATKTVLNPITKIKLKQLTERLKKNEVKALMSQIDELEPLMNKYDHDELQRKYYLVLSALKSDKCIQRYESTPADNYWESFFTYLAYCKVGKTIEAEVTLTSMDRFEDYPEDNITLLAVAGALIKGEKAEAKDYLSAVTGDYTPALQRFVDSIYLLLEPEMAKEMGADENTCAFYLVNFFNQEDPKERARKEAEAKAAEERKCKEAEKAAKEKAAAEEKARKEAEAKRKREEEERKRAEEQKRREEEARRRAAEIEAKRKAEEEARREAAEAARRREEEERKRKEAEAKRRREEEYRRRMEEARIKAEQEAKRRAEDKSTITVSKTSLTFSADGGSETVNINASGFWQLSAVPDNWAIVEERTNSIVVKALKNDAEKVRTDYLKIRCGYKDVRIDIKQNANETQTKRRDDEERKCRKEERIDNKQNTYKENDQYDRLMSLQKKADSIGVMTIKEIRESLIGDLSPVETVRVKIDWLKGLKVKCSFCKHALTRKEYYSSIIRKYIEYTLSDATELLADAPDRKAISKKNVDRIEKQIENFVEFCSKGIIMTPINLTEIGYSTYSEFSSITKEKGKLWGLPFKEMIPVLRKNGIDSFAYIDKSFKDVAVPHHYINGEFIGYEYANIAAFELGRSNIQQEKPTCYNSNIHLVLWDSTIPTDRMLF